MKINKLIIVTLILIYFSEFLLSQVWENDYYDSEILYENAELLQLTEHEINIIKIKNIEKKFQQSQNLSSEAVQDHANVFVDFENKNLNSIKIQKKNGPSFQDVAESIDSIILSTNILEESL